MATDELASAFCRGSNRVRHQPNLSSAIATTDVFGRDSIRRNCRKGETGNALTEATNQ